MSAERVPQITVVQQSVSWLTWCLFPWCKGDLGIGWMMIWITLRINTPHRPLIWLFVDCLKFGRHVGDLKPKKICIFLAIAFGHARYDYNATTAWLPVADLGTGEPGRHLLGGGRSVYQGAARALLTIILAAYRPGLFQSQAFFFYYAHALAPLVVAYAPQGSPRGLPTELVNQRWRATSGSEKYHLCLRTSWAPVRVLRGSSLQAAPTKPHSRKSTPARYAATGSSRCQLADSTAARVGLSPGNLHASPSLCFPSREAGTIVFVGKNFSFRHRPSSAPSSDHICDSTHNVNTWCDVCPPEVFLDSIPQRNMFQNPLSLSTSRPR